MFFLVLLLLLLFILGACFGSFVNVLVDRIPRSENIFLGHSHCDSCKKKLRGIDLVPVFSYLALRGKCRYCKAHIPLRVFLVEAFCGVLFVTLFTLYSSSLLSFAFLCAVSLVLLTITLIDLYEGVIPDVLLGVLGVLGILGIVLNQASFVSYLITAFASFAFFLIIFLATRSRGIGFGDVKFSFFIGFLLGFPKTIIALYLAFLTGALISIILILGRKKKVRGSTVPFGPFLSVGVLLSLLFEKEIMSFILPFLGM